MAGPTSSVAQASADLAGLVVYAIILAFFLLLVRDFLKDWLIRSISKEQTETNKAVAETLNNISGEMRAVNMQISQMQSALGWQEWRRAKDKGEMPTVLDP
jgi:predicted PurR-regulated permease PerM